VQSDLLQGFYLGDLLVEPLKGLVTGRAGSQHLPPKAVEVLLCLAATPGELVTRELLLDEVWGKDHGSQEALSHAISEIRHAFDDHPDDPHFVQTMPKRGYRLVVKPEATTSSNATVALGAKNRVRVADIGLLENLNRRGVLETSVAYLVVGWLLIQIADVVFGQLHLPVWAGTFVTVLVIAGFPIAIVLSWFLEIRDGRAVMYQLSATDARNRQFSRTYLSVIGALAAASVLVLIYDRSVGLPESIELAPVAVERLPPIIQNSFAVLPFLNIDGSNETGIFANGLVDDVITSLSRVPGLRVSSRGDSFTLTPNTASRRVRERLRVEMYLGGSVEMARDKIRVIVQLIDSESSFHLWSRSFDRPREDFWDIRDEITSLTVANVRVALPPDTRASSLHAAERPMLDAYVLYRQGVDASHLPDSIENISTALGWYDAALTVDPDYAAAHAGKCEMYVRGYTEVDDASFIDRAEAACGTALTLNPNLDIVHTALGRLYTSTGRYADAEASFRRALRIDPSSAVSFVGLGDVYFLQNRPGEAESNFRLAIGLHPGDWSVYNRLGNFLYRSGRYVEASEQYEYVVALDRNNMNGHSNLGTAYMLAGNFAAAAPAFGRALEIEPKKITYSNLGLMHYYLGQLDESIEKHRKAIDLEPGDYLAWSNLGDALWVAGSEEEARAAFKAAGEFAKQALDVNPNDPFTSMDLAWIEAMLDNSAAARTLINRALELSPDNPYTHYYNALVLLRAAETDAALSALQKAVDLGYSRKMLLAEPHFSSVRTDPRFPGLVNEG